MFHALCPMLYARSEHIDLCSYGCTGSTFRLTFLTQSIILFRASDGVTGS